MPSSMWITKTGGALLVTTLVATALAVTGIRAAGSGSSVADHPPTLESMVGERLEFRLRWGVVPAADALLEVLPTDEKNVIMFRASAETLAYVGMFYPVKEVIESTVRLPGAKVQRYTKTGRQGRDKNRDQEVVFDLEKGTAQYRRNEDLRDPIEVPPDVQDPLSSFYVFRSLPVPESGSVALNVSDGKKVVHGVITVIGKETVNTPVGTFETVIIEPELEGLGGIFKKSPGARILIWITDDERRMPVKLQSEVSIGHFTALLTKVTYPAGEGIESSSTTESHKP
jgi:hypothetical protein